MTLQPVYQSKHAWQDAGLPARTGVGLKPQQLREVLQLRPDVGFFEVHAENFMVAGGPLLHWLGQVREAYPLTLHGVGLSIGGESPLDDAHLARLAALVQRYQPAVVSEHLAWSSHGGICFNDLLPIRYDRSTLERVCQHVDQVQSRLRRTVLLENPSTYVEFRDTDFSEAEFISEVVRRSGCGLLLDVTNVHVSCVNHGRDARAYLAGLPLDAVAQMHLAGFSRDEAYQEGQLLIDDHGSDVTGVVLDLYRSVIDRIGPLPTLIERDNNIPPLEVLVQEANDIETAHLLGEQAEEAA
jgi:uncharacterized protein (UPF0276 family)